MTIYIVLFIRIKWVLTKYLQMRSEKWYCLNLNFEVYFSNLIGDIFSCLKHHLNHFKSFCFWSKCILICIFCSLFEKKVFTLNQIAKCIWLSSWIMVWGVEMCAGHVCWPCCSMSIRDQPLLSRTRRLCQSSRTSVL